MFREQWNKGPQRIYSLSYSMHVSSFCNRRYLDLNCVKTIKSNYIKYLRGSIKKNTKTFAIAMLLNIILLLDLVDII